MHRPGIEPTRTIYNTPEGFFFSRGGHFSSGGPEGRKRLPREKNIPKGKKFHPRVTNLIFYHSREAKGFFKTIFDDFNIIKYVHILVYLSVLGWYRTPFFVRRTYVYRDLKKFRSLCGI